MSAMTILVVEDDPRVADFLQRGLRAEGYRVLVARGGDEAITLVSQEACGVILLDLMLPQLSGIEVCQILRAKRNDIPILMLTAMGAIEDRVAGLRCGADDYLTKPFAFDELLARIEALQRRSRSLVERNTQLQVGDLVFDRNQMTVSCGSKPVAFTSKELAFMELLMSSPGRVFSRERILSNVWGTHEDPLTNVVDVYVRRLRSKLQEHGRAGMIHTLRGLGYKIQATS